MGYAHTIKCKLINCSWTVVGLMAAVGKGPHFLQKNPPIEFSGYGPAGSSYPIDILASTCVSTCLDVYFNFKKPPYHH